MTAARLFVLEVCLVLVNVVCLAFFDGGLWNWLAIAVCGAFAIAALVMWQAER